MDRKFISHTKIPISVIIINFFTFPFNGIYLIYRRSAKPYEALENSRAIKYCGWLLISLAIIPTVLGFSNFLDSLRIFGTIWGLPGLYTLLRAYLISKYIGNHQINSSDMKNKVDSSTNITGTYQNMNNTYSHNVAPTAPTQFKIATCPGCGAKKKIKVGTVDNCDYCDTPLIYND